MAEFDLKANRCPNAQILMRKVITEANKNSLKRFELLTIEPSLERSVRAFLNDLGISFEISKSEIVISEDHKKGWSKEFDEEDWLDVTLISIFKIEVKS